MLAESARIDALLQTIPFFSQLRPEQLAGLREAGRIESAPADQILFYEGDPATSLYLILKGSVRIRAKAHNGKDMVLSTLQAGDFFGELALAEGGIRTASVEVRDESEFFLIERQDFTQLLAASPELLSDVIGAISQKMRGANDNLFQQLLEKQELQLQLERDKHQTVAQMVTGVAHEINTPLGILNALTTDLLDQSLNSLVSPEHPPLDAKEMLESLRLMQKHLVRLRQLVQTFRHVSAAQIGESPEWVSPGQVMQEALELYQLASPRRLAVTLQIDSELAETTWFGFPSLLQDCLIYLMTNIEAHAYPEADGPVFWRLQLVELENEPGFEIAVIDNGAGIDAVHLPRVCEPFFTTARQRGYRGLGLTIVQNLVQNIFEGQLKIASEPGLGTQIQSRFPFQIKLKEEPRGALGPA